jgi:serine/threonine-protein kinase RsbW
MHQIMNADDTADFRSTFAARPASVPVARRELRRWLECHRMDEARIPDVLLAVTEACANAARHAYPEGDGVVRIHAVESAGQVSVVVRDYGTSIPRARTRSTGLGLGLPMMSRLATKLEISTSPGFGTEVRMRFARTGPMID